jgi:hypothetical protein
MGNARIARDEKQRFWHSGFSHRLLWKGACKEE